MMDFGQSILYKGGGERGELMTGIVNEEVWGSIQSCYQIYRSINGSM